MSKQKTQITEYRNYYLPYDFPVFLLSGDYWKISSIKSNNLHFHNCLEIGICHSESGYMDFNKIKAPLSFKAGDVTCIPRNIPHTTWSEAGTESHWSYIYVDVGEFMKLFLPNTSAQNFDLSVAAYKNYKYIITRDECPDIYPLTISIVNELEGQKQNFRTCAAGLLISLIVKLCRIQSAGGEAITSSENPPENAMVLSAVLDYIDEHYAESIDIDYLAEISHLSPTHFRRLFHNIIGTSPLDFLNKKRIDKACDLLVSTEDPIVNISEAVGFKSLTSFNRHFAEQKKTTPRTYRHETLSKREQLNKTEIRRYKGWLYPEK